LVHDHRGNRDYRDALAELLDNWSLLYMNLKPTADTEPVLQRAKAIREQLVQDYPNVPEYQYALAKVHWHLGILSRRARRFGDARAFQQQALLVMQQLVREHPKEVAFAIGLAQSYGEMANTLQDAGKFHESLDWYARNIATFEEALRREPRHSEVRMWLSNTYVQRAETLVRLARRDEAVKDWKRIIELGEGESHVELRINRAAALAHDGDHVPAATEISALVATNQESAYGLYNPACVFALCAAAAAADGKLPSAERHRLAEQYSQSAIGLLRKLQVTGFFRLPGNADLLHKDTDLEALRNREDFQKLLHEIVNANRGSK
jgi:tetratricopeptide (TPR) repeat protein